MRCVFMIYTYHFQLKFQKTKEVSVCMFGYEISKKRKHILPAVYIRSNKNNI